MGTPESKAKWHTVAKDTLYDYHPKLDYDVITTNRNIADAEDKLGVTMDVQLESDPICSSSGCTQYAHPEKPKGHPMNYAVPDFGVDEDIKTGKRSIDIAEKMHTHKWKWEDTKPREITQYDTSKGLDVEMKASLKNLDDQEYMHGYWNNADV